LVICIALAVWLGSLSAFAASKDEAVALADDIMKATLKTQQNDNATFNDPYNAIMDVILNRRTGGLLPHIKKLDQNGNKNIDLFKTFLTLSEMPNETFSISDNYTFLNNKTFSESWRTQYLSNILLAQLHLDKSDILKTLEFTGEAIEIVNNQTVTAESTSMLYDAYEVLHSVYIYDRSNWMDTV